MPTRLLLAALVALAATGAAAQTARPLAFDRPTSAVETLRLPAVANATLLARNAPAPDAPVRFAEPFSYRLDARAAGTWEQVGADRVWRLVVESPGAYSLNFGFSRFRLPEGAALWIYAPGAAPEYRPFTSADNEAHGELWTPIVPGGRAVIELDLAGVKPGDEADVELVLGQVGHGFRPALLTAGEKNAMPAEALLSGSCNVDVVCAQGDPYRAIIRSVGAYTRAGTDICSGAAVNTTRGDAEPNFLTANHCNNSAANAASVVVYWNYQNSTCRTPGSAASGGTGDGSRSQFNTGTVFRGASAGSDWNLLTLDDPILPAAQVYLSGWDRRDLAPARVIGIHHPSVEEKRISFENDPTTITTYGSATATPTGTHIRVADWDEGTTEGGSSGSPLYNAEQRIVGQLHGGSASCGNDAPDWYGRLFTSMNTGLAAFLDPTGSGAQTVNGREASSALFARMTATPTELGRGQTARVTVTVTNTSSAATAGVRYTTGTAAAPSGIAYAGNGTVSAGAVATAGGTVTWTVDLAAGASATFSYDVVVGPQASVGTLAHAGTVAHPSLAAPATASTTFQIVVPPDVLLSNTTAVAVPDNACPADATSQITVPAGFDPVAVKVGVNATHTFRGDLNLRIASAAGTVVSLVNNVGGAAENLDALFSDTGAAGAFASGDHDPAAPFYDVEGRAGGALAPLAAENPAGTWTLRVCDDAGDDVGRVNRWALYFYTAGATAGEPAVVATPEVTVEAVRPNPAAGAASVRFAARRAQHVRATVLDATGRTVAVLLDAAVPAGAFQTLAVDAARLPSGTYFVRIAGEAFVETRTVSVVR